MKRFILFFTPLLLSAQVAVSIKPLKLWVGEIYPGQITVIVPQNRSPHLFSPTPKEISEILKAKLVFKIGAGLEPWRIPGAREVNLARGVSLIYKDGIPNPHYWLSPKRMLQALPLVENALEEAFPSLRGKIRERAERERKRLLNLHRKISLILSPYRQKTIVLYRPAWVYLVKDYGFPEPTIITTDPSRPPTPAKLRHIKGDLLVFDPSLPENKAHLLSRWLKIPFVYLDPLAIEEEYSSYEDFIMKNVQKIVRGLQ